MLSAPFMGRYFRNHHPIGQSLDHLPEDPQITPTDKFYLQLIPIFIRLISTENACLSIVSNFRNQTIIQIIKISHVIYVLRRNVKTQINHLVTDLFFNLSDKIGYFGHTIFLRLTQLSS